jgi:hypothetical protein
MGDHERPFQVVKRLGPAAMQNDADEHEMRERNEGATIEDQNVPFQRYVFAFEVTAMQNVGEAQETA